MSFKQVIELADLLDDGRVTGEDVVKYVTMSKPPARR